MYNVKKVNEDLYWIGASDRRLALFENIYPIPRGVSYNSYVILDEHTVLLDTVDKAVSGQFFENLEHVLGERKLDYIIVNHMEPDQLAAPHSAGKSHTAAEYSANSPPREYPHRYTRENSPYRRESSCTISGRNPTRRSAPPENTRPLVPAASQGE